MAPPLPARERAGVRVKVSCALSPSPRTLPPTGARERHGKPPRSSSPQRHPPLRLRALRPIVPGGPQPVSAGHGSVASWGLGWFGAE